MPGRKRRTKKQPEKTAKMAEEEDTKDWRDDWEGYSYQAPDYVPGEHPMEKGDVTWHHVLGTTAYSRRRV